MVLIPFFPAYFEGLGTRKGSTGNFLFEAQFSPKMLYALVFLFINASRLFVDWTTPFRYSSSRWRYGHKPQSNEIKCKTHKQSILKYFTVQNWGSPLQHVVYLMSFLNDYYTKLSLSVGKLRACLHGGGWPRVGEITRLGGVTRLSVQSLILIW